MWHRPKRTGDHPPLDANFFRRAPRHALRNLLRRVISHAAELGEADLLASAPPVSLEQHFGRLFFEMQRDPREQNVAAYYDLIRLYSDELLATTSWMSGRSGPLRQLIELELRRGYRLSIVTFNHDLLIENALVQVPSRTYGNVWCMSHAYGLGDLETIDDPTSDTFSMDCPGDRARHIPVYKLHGSVNWVFKTLRANPPSEASRRRRELLIWINRVIRPRVRNVTWPTGSGRGGRGSWYLWSLIVPPIYEKGGFIRNELKGVWDRAADALESADRVIFWGYSFPQADVYSRYFFQRAANVNSALRRPILINPDPASHHELWSILQPRRVDHYRDVRAYLLRNT
jgi:hypothetical protein